MRDAASLSALRADGRISSETPRPLTSGPVAFFLAVDQGVRFAAAAAIGSMTGAGAQAAFCLLCGRLARHGRWGWALLAGSLAFAAATAVLQCVALSLAWLVPIVIGTLVVALVLMPKDSEPRAPALLPPWDIPARMIVTTVLVLVARAFAGASRPPSSSRAAPSGPAPRGAGVIPAGPGGPHGPPRVVPSALVGWGVILGWGVI